MSNIGFCSHLGKNNDLERIGLKKCGARSQHIPLIMDFGGLNQDKVQTRTKSAVWFRYLEGLFFFSSPLVYNECSYLDVRYKFNVSACQSTELLGRLRLCLCGNEE